MAYTAPTIADFRARYPAFDTIADATVQAWLDDGDAATAAFPDEDRPRAVMLFAAHNLQFGTEAGKIAASGLSSFKSGTFSATVSESASARTGFAATLYGRDYLNLARQFTGPRLAWSPPA